MTKGIITFIQGVYYTLDIVKVLSKSRNANKKAKLNINDFVGIWSKEEAAEIKKAIADTCKQSFVKG